MTVIVLLILVSAAMLAPGLVVGPSLDAAVFSHIGGRLLDGVAPYVGAWDHKPPGIYLASAASQAVLGWLGPWTADWLLSGAATVGLGAAVAATLGRLRVSGWPRTLGAVGATVLAGHYLLALGGGLAEPLGAVAVAWALVLALGPPSGFRAAGIGALAGVSILFSVQLAPAVLLVLALALVLRPSGARWPGTVAMGLGVVGPPAGAVAWLAAIGVLPEAITAIVTYATAYRASSGEYGGILGAPVASWSVLASLFLIAPALLGAAELRRTGQPRRGVMIASLVWIGGSLALFVVQGRFYAHYVIPLAIPLGILAGIGLDRVRESLGRVAGAVSRAVIVLPLVVTLLVSATAGVLSGAMVLAPVADQSGRMRAVAELLDDLPDGSLLVWGNQPHLYDLAGRDPATAYSYFYPLTTPGFSTAAMVGEAARELAADPPAVVVDAGSSAPGQPGFLPLLIDRPITTDGRDLDLLDPLRTFVADHYDLTATVAGWPIYVLRAASVE